VLEFKPEQLWLNNTKSSCLNANSQLFVQYTCEIKPSEQSSKFYGLCVVTFLGALTVCLFALFVRGHFLSGKVRQIECDANTISASDFTMQL
jgi:hypothetical protein